MDEHGLSRFRALRGIQRTIQWIVGVAVPICGAAFVADIPSRLFDASLFAQQYLGLFIGLMLFYTFISIPFRPGSDENRVPWYDWILGAVSLAGGLYVAFFYEKLLMQLGVLIPFRIWLGAAFILTLFEAMRRLLGWTLLIIIVVFIFYGRFGHLFPGFLATREISSSRLISQLYLNSEFLFGTPLQVAGTVVLSFMLLGQFLFSTGGSEFVTRLAESVMGKYRGSAAKIAVVSSALFGTISGSAVGNVAAIGTITIPMMKRSGYPSYYAAGVEATASTGGLIMPPIMGAAAFIMAELLGVPYSQIALTALVPALLYYGGLLIQVDLRAAKDGLKGTDPAKIPSLRKIIPQGWPVIISVGVLIWALFGWYLRAEAAALWSLATLITLASFSPSTRAHLRNVPRILESVTRGMLEVAITCAGAGLIVGVVSYTGLGLSLTAILTDLGGSHLFLLLVLTTIASIILGMGMPVTASYLFLAVSVAPAMVAIGVPPILAHLFVFYYGAYADLTPPVCITVYTAASIAQAPMLKSAVQAMKLAAAGYLVPFIFIYKPETVLIGSPLDITLGIADAVVAVFLLAIAAEGYFRRPLPGGERILYTAASLAFFVPGWTSRCIGLALVVPLLVYNFYVLPTRAISPLHWLGWPLQRRGLREQRKPQDQTRAVPGWRRAGHRGHGRPRRFWRRLDD
jgi:TRAP transporter 4TM/12TM fusion protein